jgi:predicted ester cyclase
MTDNAEIVRRIETAWDRNDIASLDQYFAPDFDNSQNAFPNAPRGLDGAKMAHAMAMAAFPDRKIEILNLISEGDSVLVRSRVTGTNTGGAPFLGAPEPNGAQLDIEAWAIYQLRDGKVVRSFGLNDAFRGMLEMGSITPPM